MDDWNDRTGRRVPTGRLGRMGRLGGLAGGVLGSAALRGAGDLLSGRRPDAGRMLLTPGNATRIADGLAGMRGAAMKVGQLMSMEAGDILPDDLAVILGRLRAEADFMPPAQLKQVLAANWGAGFLSRFARFDVRPIAAASIGQVHRAQTKDGRDLAIKVQYPGIRDSIDSDLRNLGSLLRMSGMLPAGLDMGPILQEAGAQLHEEADYEAERRHLARFATLLEGEAGVIVPRPHDDLSTGDILAMDFVDSQPIETVTEAGQAARDEIMDRLIALTLREVFDFRLVQTDPNFANYRYRPETGALVLLDFGATRSFDASTVEGYRRLVQAARSGDRAALHDAALALDFFAPATPPGYVAQVLDMMEIAAGVLHRPGPLDFARDPTLPRLREMGFDLGRARALPHIPPVGTLLLQRKVAGLYLLGARLRARVDLQRHLARMT